MRRHHSNRFLLPLLLLVVALLILLSQHALAASNTTLNLSAFKITYHFAVQINVSKLHMPTYLTPFNAKGNFTLNIPKPRVVQGVTPRLGKPVDTQLDVVVREGGIVKLDPRTCPNDLAYCYRVIEHEQNRTTFGKNYTAVSSYLLPTRRIMQYVCAGNNAECVSASTNCFCPTLTIPPSPVLAETGNCSANTHLCLADYGDFVMCTGNLSSCKQTYRKCGCGPTTACASQRNTCINNNKLILCSGSLAECAGKYPTCYCGPDMMAFQQGCATLTHTCAKGNQTVICYGQLSSCALNYDKCDC